MTITWSGSLPETWTLGTAIDALDTPEVVVDLTRLERNIRQMAELATTAGVNLRPHTKSHKTAAIARRQLAAGAHGITVAKLDEAEAYLSQGVDDIFVANEVAGPWKWARTAALQKRGSVAVGVDCVAAAHGLEDAARGHGVTPAGPRSPSATVCAFRSTTHVPLRIWRRRWLACATVTSKR